MEYIVRVVMGSFVGNPLGELVGTGGKAFSAMLCFMFALVHRDDA